jgi:hypothetical protein
MKLLLASLLGLCVAAGTMAQNWEWCARKITVSQFHLVKYFIYLLTGHNAYSAIPTMIAEYKIAWILPMYAIIVSWNYRAKW